MPHGKERSLNAEAPSFGGERPRRSRAIAVLAVLPVLAVAALAMVGWIARVPWLVRVTPGSPAMTFSTALCLFLLAGAVLLAGFSQRWARNVRSVVGVALTLLGAAVLVQYRWDIGLPMDLAPMHAWLDGNPGRMAPNTALAITLAGLTLLLVTHAPAGIRGVPGLVGAFAVAMMGITGIVGYRLHAELLYGWHVATRMSLLTAGSLVLLGLGLAAAGYRAQRLGELFRRREDLRVGLLGGALMVFVGLVGGLAAFTLLQEQTDSVLRNALKVSLDNRQAHLAAAIPSLIHRTAEFVARPEVRRDLARAYVAPGDREARAAVESWLNGQSGAGLASLRLLDARGRVLTSVGPALDEIVALPVQHASGGAELVWGGGSAKLRTAQPFVADGAELGTVELVYALPVVTHMVDGAQETNASAELLSARGSSRRSAVCLRGAPRTSSSCRSTRSPRRR
jgi:hypothetical protein